MDMKQERFIDDLFCKLDLSLKNVIACQNQLNEARDLLVEYQFDAEDEFYTDVKPVVILPGAKPWKVDDLLSVVEKLPLFISTSDLVKCGIYHNRSTLNKKLSEGKISKDLFVDAGNRRLFLKEKLLEHINDFYA